MTQDSGMDVSPSWQELKQQNANLRAQLRKRAEWKEEMAGSSAQALQEIGTALDLLPGTDIHKSAVPAIKSLQVRNENLRGNLEIALANEDQLAGKVRALKDQLGWRDRRIAELEELQLSKAEEK